MRAYATATSTTASYEVIRDAATPGIGNKPAKTTTIPYRDILTRLWLLGALFESLVALNLRVCAQAAEAEVRHLRTHRGDREGDFIITGTTPE